MKATMGRTAFGWPKISIVTPSYNQAEFLERAIQSVLSQGYPNLEYMIIDGGSTDSSLDIIRKYEAHLCWVSERDRGQTDALRKGFERATGDILAWLNSDDTYAPGAFFKVAEAFREHPDADLVFGNYHWVDEQDAVLAEVRHTRFDFEAFIYLGGTIHQSAAFWTREAYWRVGGLDLSFEWSMDADLLARIASTGSAVFARELLANFRQHAKTKTYRGLQMQQHEWEKRIQPRYIPVGQTPFRRKLIVAKCQLKRAWCFCYQGDANYVVRGVWKRLARLADLRWQKKTD